MRKWWLLVLAGSCGCAMAGADAECNGDVPQRRCTATVFTDAAFQKVGADRSVCAALTWRTGVPHQDASGSVDELSNVTNYARVVAPQGEKVYLRDDVSSVVEAQLCWELKPIKSKIERPAKVRDGREKMDLTCEEKDPKELAKVAPWLLQIGRVSIDPQAGRMLFFGEPLALIKHDGSAYMGISKELAATVDKTSGNYNLVLHDGRAFLGACRSLVKTQ